MKFCYKCQEDCQKCKKVNLIKCLQEIIDNATSREIIKIEMPEKYRLVTHKIEFKNKYPVLFHKKDFIMIYIDGCEIKRVI